ncbi:sensor histidine kinase [Billgrantia kenyensis]|uniref:histidine kinase n=1 Tax=Billgrantia kenyensis TaxID=321266 RepID=A0A7V9VZN7_9GAMM|nr:HAMP domain-containing sensor histidine kinase [Halomonas kenyensis]MBA2778325.1 HAMP domain-containing histidine kinase [Halomonas kenyensis]MCG6660632.1 HAMP domain-containing histidine kinase [Halomonas kenyensis]
MTRRSPMVVFLVATLLLVGSLIGVSATVASRFFQTAILERESQQVHDLVGSLLGDADDLAPRLAPEMLDRQLQHLLALEDILRINVFGHDLRLIWSSEPDRIGRKARREAPLRTALGGELAPVLRPFAGAPAPDWSATDLVMEFYVPIWGENGDPVAAMGVYRDATHVKAMLARGQRLVWLTAGTVGLLLILTVTGLHGLLLRRHRAALASLSALDEEHRRLVQLEKMSALGKMVADIAHQVNSPLVGVVNKAQLAQRYADDPERVACYLRDIESAGRHCADFVRRLLELSRVSRFEVEPVVLEQIVQEAVQLVRQSHRTPVNLHATPDLDAVMLAGDPILLRHAIFNLLRNAQVFSPPEGHVDVRLEGQPGKLTLEVEDQGPGVAPEDRERIFQPFVTTLAEGSGLGLAVVHTVATLHGGVVEVGQGTAGGALFRLVLPASDSEQKEVGHARPGTDRR